jgi:hypothetical protein
MRVIRQRNPIVAPIWAFLVSGSSSEAFLGRAHPDRAGARPLSTEPQTPNSEPQTLGRDWEDPSYEKRDPRNVKSSYSHSIVLGGLVEIS